MKAKLLYFILLIFFFSCATMKWKQRYAAKNVQRFIYQYGKGNELTTGALPPELFRPSRSLTRREFKKKFNHMELLLAIVPDSMIHKSNKTDSFYTNIYKIQYLNKHHLKTDNMIFGQ